MASARLNPVGRANAIAPRRRGHDLGRPDRPPRRPEHGQARLWRPSRHRGRAGRPDASLSAGATLFDTAAMYGGGAAERRLGELARGRDVQVATKLPPAMLNRADDMPAALEASLARLDGGSVDLYMHHFPGRWVSIPKLMDLMANAVEQGKVRAVGVSNYTADQLRVAHTALAERGIPLASIENGYSLRDRRVETNGVLDACCGLGVTLIAYQPLASGALTGMYADGTRPRGLRRFIVRHFRGSAREAVARVTDRPALAD